MEAGQFEEGDIISFLPRYGLCFNSVAFHANRRYILVRPETTKETQTLSFPYISKVSSLQSFVKLIS
jgi:hypothetical protein